MNRIAHLARRLSPALFVLPLAATLAGCGVGPVTLSAPGTLMIQGHVHGGIQPVSGATVELFSVGTAGNGSAATDVLQHPVITDANSYFSVAGDYTCSSANEELYLVVRGGNPGLVGNVNNPALVMMSALGRCTDLINTPNASIWVNEVSTVAAAYALAPFMKSYDHVGASATNVVGLSNAFLNAQLLANTANGQAASLASNLTVEQSKLYALADALVPCVNSTGGTPCSALFAAATPSGGTRPTNVVDALLNIVKHPGNNVAAVFNLISSTPPFPNALMRAPNDWTMSLTVTGGGLSEPTAMSVDRSGNVWVANFVGPAYDGSGNSPGGVVAYSPQGTPFSGTPFGTGNESEVYGLTLDKNGDVWITSEENVAHDGSYGSIGKIAGANSGAPGAYLGTFYDDSLNFPESIATDPVSGNILVGNYAGSSATFYDVNGHYLNNVGTYSAAFPDDLVSDGAGGVWLANQGDYTITHVAADGTVQRPNCCSEADTVALDPQGNVWVTNFGAINGSYTISEVSPTGSVLIHGASVPGLSTPSGAAVDAGGQFWVLNYHSGSLIGIAGNNNVLAPGSGLSPIALGKDANLLEPFSIAPDASGNLWVTNRAQNNVVMFFGLATPTQTPIMARPVAP